MGRLVALLLASTLLIVASVGGSWDVAAAVSPSHAPAFAYDNVGDVARSGTVQSRSAPTVGSGATGSARRFFGLLGHLYDSPVALVATNAIPRPGQLADDVAEAVGGVAKPATSGTGQVITIPHGNREIVIRIMAEGGGRTSYYRVSVAGKEALTVAGEASVDRALTHIPIGEGSFDDILRLVNQLSGGGG